MPRYELSLVLRMIERTRVVAAMERCVNAIFDKGGVVRKIEYLGTRSLPHKISSSSLTYFHGNFFLVDFHGSVDWEKELSKTYIRDTDVLRSRINTVDGNEKTFDCTLSDELLPPAYRPSVKKLIAKKPVTKEKLGNRFVLTKEFYPF